jgi:hypothetical protein
MTHENAENRIYPPRDYRVWVNDERTVLLRVWNSGEAEIAMRDKEAHSWGPPIRMVEER